MRNHSFKFRLLILLFVCLTLLTPSKNAQATWMSILWETFDLPWGTWPWRIAGNQWVVLPPSGYRWGIVHEIYHYPFNDQSIWCAGMLNGGITNLTPFVDTYPPNLNTKAIWGPFSLVDAVEADCNFWHWNYTENYYDYLLWGAALDPNANTIYEGDRTSGFNYDWNWHNVVMDLADLKNAGGDSVSLLGQQNVWIVFLFHSNSSQQYWGAFLDDISLGWNDGLFDLATLVPQIMDLDSNLINYPTEGNQYIMRLQWQIEGEGSTGPFTIELDIDEETFFSDEFEFTVNGDTTLFTYADQLWGGAIGPHTLEWTLDVFDQVEETYEDNNYALMPFEVVQFDSLPWIVITHPAEDDSADQGFWIQWEDYDRESNASIYLYYDTDSLGYNGALINYTPVYEDTDPDSYWWNTASFPNNAQFYVYAIINDGYNPMQFDYSDFPLTIYHPSGSILPEKGNPRDFALKGCYPNPFNASASIVFSTPQTVRATLTVYDVTGRMVDTIFNGEVSSGEHIQTWNPQVGSGVYFCKIQMTSPAGQNFEATIKMLFIR